MVEIFKLLLFDINKELCDTFIRYFGKYESVEIFHSRLEDLPSYDCMVSPANSFGIMDGGIDLAITRMFGKQLMDRVQQHVIEEYYGEQPIGTSFIIPTHNEKHPYLAHTPTMRVPMSITRTDNVYQAMKAMLIAVESHNKRNINEKIEVVACSGLGTATGKVDFDSAVRQMELAYSLFLNRPCILDWNYAISRNSKIIQSL